MSVGVSSSKTNQATYTITPTASGANSKGMGSGSGAFQNVEGGTGLTTNKGDNSYVGPGSVGNRSTSGSNATAGGANSIALGSLAGLKGNVNISTTTADPEVAKAAMSGMEAVLAQALASSGGTSTQTLQLLSSELAQQQAASAGYVDQNNQQLNSALTSLADLATHVQSNGTDRAQSTTNYTIFGLMALAGFALWAVFRPKS